MTVNEKRRKLHQDITGRRFGKLLALVRADNDKDGSIMWNCKCDCGVEKTRRYSLLLNGHTKSCGCLGVEIQRTIHLKAPGYSGMMQLLLQYKRSAKLKNHLFSLSVEQFKTITSSNCYYCGTPPKRTKYNNKTKLHSHYTYNGIDRKDNDLGYTTENSIPCCFTCNDWKSNMPYEEFLLHINKIAYKHGGNK